jgi:hypothetical protein
MSNACHPRPAMMLMAPPEPAPHLSHQEPLLHHTPHVVTTIGPAISLSTTLKTIPAPYAALNTAPYAATSQRTLSCPMPATSSTRPEMMLMAPLEPAPHLSHQKPLLHHTLHVVTTISTLTVVVHLLADVNADTKCTLKGSPTPYKAPCATTNARTLSCPMPATSSTRPVFLWGLC